MKILVSYIICICFSFMTIQAHSQSLDLTENDSHKIQSTTSLPTDTKTRISSSSETINSHNLAKTPNKTRGGGNSSSTQGSEDSVMHSAIEVAKAGMAGVAHGVGDQIESQGKGTAKENLNKAFKDMKGAVKQAGYGMGQAIVDGVVHGSKAIANHVKSTFDFSKPTSKTLGSSKSVSSHHSKHGSHSQGSKGSKGTHDSERGKSNKDSKGSKGEKSSKDSKGSGDRGSKGKK